MANRINVSHGSKEKFCYSDFLTFTKFPKDEIKCERLKQTDKTPCVKPQYEEDVRVILCVTVTALDFHGIMYLTYQKYCTVS